MHPSEAARRSERRGTARLGLGCWPLGGPAHNLGVAMGWSELSDAAAQAAVERALMEGIRRFDTADAYGIGRSEQRLGRALSGFPRGQVFLTSKVGYLQPVDGGSPLRRDNLLASLDGTLDRLRTDYLDVYFLHHNAASARELDEFAQVLDSLRMQGVVRAIGARGPHRFAGERRGGKRSDKQRQFQAMFDRVRPEVVSLRANLLTPLPVGSESVYDWVTSRGAAVQVYKPLAQGLLTSSYGNGFSPPFVDGDHRSRKGWFTPAAFGPLVALRAGLQRIVPDYSVAELALAWVEHYLPDAVLLFGSTNPDHIGEIVDARRIALGTDELAEIARLAETYRQQVPSYLD